MKKILVIGAGKSSTCLIDYLLEVCAELDWQLSVADSNLEMALSKTGKSTHAKALSLRVENASEREGLIRQADLVISLLPASLHILVAGDCLTLGKNLLTASYIDDNTRSLEKEVRDKGLLFLCEMGLDPGIDHMSAMQIIDGIRRSGDSIVSFRSHCGGLVAPESDDNPWHYKISWNPRNIVAAGSTGAVFKNEGKIIKRAYEDLFNNCDVTQVPGYGDLAFYPNRDSLSYIPLYGMEKASTFIRTTFRDPAFCDGWLAIVKAGLTSNKPLINKHDITYKTWSEPILPFVNGQNKVQLNFLGLFDNDIISATAKTSADVLQYLLETRLSMEATDRDMIVMLHELEYISGGERKFINSSLIVKGEDNVRTAMAKTVGLPLGIAARLILERKISLTGLHIPIIPEIYNPVLRELSLKGIVFHETSGSR